MSKSKYNYRVYNGKALKKLFENSRLFILAFLFAAGILIGAIAVNGDSSLFQKVSNISQSFVAARSEQGIAENFCSSLTVCAAFMLSNVFLGFSLIGYPAIIWLPFVRGLGIGAVTGYLYSAFKMTGLGYCILTMYPGAVVSTVAFILACNDSCDYSKNAFLKAIRGRGQFEKDETKVYIIRQLIFTGVCAASSIIDALFSSVFSRFFEI